MPESSGLVNILRPEEVTADANQPRSALEGGERELRIRDGLTQYLLSCWEAARRAREEVTDRLEACLRQRNGEYSPEKLAEIESYGGSTVFMMLTNVKCRAAESWVRDILTNAGDNPWTLEPTPKPELPPVYMKAIRERVRDEAAQLMSLTNQPVSQEAMVLRMEQIADMVRQKRLDEAKKIAERMSVEIDDQLTEGGYHEAFDALLQDICTYPTAFLKGPVIRMRKRLVWGRDAQGNYTPTVSKRLVEEFDRISPFKMYPAPGTSDLNRGFLFEQHDLTRSDLESMIGVPGYKESAIRSVLSKYGSGGLQDWLWQASDEEDDTDLYNEYDSPDTTIQALEFWGAIQGKLLREWGMPESDIPDEDLEYDVDCWFIGEDVIKVSINTEPLGRKPYYKACFCDVPGSMWGVALPELMRDIQDICNACARSLVNNMAIGSGPQAEVAVDRVPPGEDITSIYPWKIWPTTSDQNMSAGGSPAVRFFQPESQASELMSIYQYFSKLADDYTGIPAYAYGGTFNIGGAGRTSSGLAMLMSAASKGIKQVITNIDKGLIEPLISRMYQYNMLYNPDNSIKGDLRAKARGSASLVAREQLQMRRAEFLANTANPVDLEIMGKRGRATVLREVARSLEMPTNKVVPPDEELAVMMAQAGAGPGPQAGPTPPNPVETDVAGQPLGGRESNLFRSGGR